MTKYTPKKITAKLEDEAVAATSQTSPEQRGERNRGRPVLVRTAAEGLSRSEAYEQTIDVPPPAEQRRIVAKVNELMGQCDTLEAARTEREKKRDRLAAASLGRCGRICCRCQPDRSGCQ